MQEILAKLNEEQRQAVIHDNGPLLIVAGAGTGKTTVLINRLLYLISAKQVRADNILLLTFTEKAAGELVERADRALPYGYVDLWISTFHSLADRILRDHGLDIGLPTDYRLLNQTEQWLLIKKNLAEFKLNYYRPLGNPNKFIAELVKHFSRLKDENISAEEYLSYAESVRQDQDAMLSGAKIKKDKVQLDKRAKLDTAKINELANAYHLYNRLLLAGSCLDFGDLINYTLKLLRERPAILQYYQEKFRYVMVDEFQDTNWSQYELIKLLAAPTNNLLAVGDDDQSIFKFRGASLSNIMQFKDDYPTAKEVVLKKNYRSGRVILERAQQFIAHNNPYRLEIKLGLDKRLEAVRDLEGEARYLFFPNQLAETQGVIDLINQQHQPGVTDWSDLAILVRANSTANRFVAECARRNIPHQFVSLRGLYDKPIIMDALAYVRLLDNYHETAALFRVLNLDAFHLDHLDFINLNKFARTKLWSLYETLTNLPLAPQISSAGQTSVKKLLAVIKNHTQLAKTATTSRLFVEVVRDVFLPHLDEDSQRQEFSYLNQFYRKIISFEEANPAGLLPDFLSLIEWELEAGDSGALQPEMEDADTVKIMTVHTAKGLEFKGVFLVDAVDKKFPTISRSEVIPLADALVKEELPGGDTHLEEERRLFYVAMTRAKESFVASGARDVGGVSDKKPSKFIAEAALPVAAAPEKVLAAELQRDLTAAAAAPPSQPAYEVPNKFSFSQLRAFKDCPWLYKHLYILKIPLPPKPALVFGQVVHNTLRNFLLPLVLSNGQADLFGQAARPDPKQLSWDNLLKIYQDNWQDYGFDDRRQAEEYRQRGREMLKNFFARLTDEGWPTVWLLEKRFNWRLGQYLLEGGVDRLDRLSDGTAAIIDYKTGEAKSRLTFDDKEQLLIYQAALEELLGIKVSRLTFYYLASGEENSFVATPAELARVKEETLATIEAIGKFDFTPTPGHVCRYCDWRQFCEHRQN